MGKVRVTQAIGGRSRFCKDYRTEKCGQPSNRWDYSMIKYNISDVTVGMDVRVKLGDSMSKSGRIIQLYAGRTRFTHFCTVFNCVLQPTEGS